MTRLCCDTSTLAKVYVPEPESRGVRARLEAVDEVCASLLGRVELMAVFHRRLREGTWTAKQFQSSVRQFKLDDASGYWRWLPLDGPVPGLAAELFATLGVGVFLRASDCLHLVTARHHGFTEFHTHDRHQESAALALGLTPIRLR